MAIVTDTYGGVGATRTYDTETGITQLVSAPFHFYDDFLGNGPLDAAIGGPWDTTTVGTADPVIHSTGFPWGAVQLYPQTLGDEACLTWGDRLNLKLVDLLGFEFQCRVTVPSGDASEGVQLALGLSSEYTADKADLTNCILFRAEEFGQHLYFAARTDDGTTETGATSTTEIVSGQTYVLGCDLRDRQSVKFYVNGQRILEGTTFPITAFTTATLLQPIMSLAMTDVLLSSLFEVDYIRIWGNRT